MSVGLRTRRARFAASPVLACASTSRTLLVATPLLQKRGAKRAAPSETPPPVPFPRELEHIPLSVPFARLPGDARKHMRHSALEYSTAMVKAGYTAPEIRQIASQARTDGRISHRMSEAISEATRREKYSPVNTWWFRGIFAAGLCLVGWQWYKAMIETGVVEGMTKEEKEAQDKYDKEMEWYRRIQEYKEKEGIASSASEHGDKIGSLPVPPTARPQKKDAWLKEMDGRPKW